MNGEPPMIDWALESELPDPTSIPGATYAPRFADFYRDQYRSAVRLAVVLTGSASVAEDLVQDVMADAHRRWGDLQGYDEPVAWLRRALVNRSISWHRRAAVAGRGLLRLANRPEPPYGLEAADWELWRRVRALPARQAQVVALVYVEHLTLAEAAAVLGIAVPTAKTSLARAKQRLARDLSDWRTPQ